MSTSTTDAGLKFKSLPQELFKDNQELRDICCYLDDTRQKSKKLAQEWQSFGRYTASVLRSEVIEFETKISILQEKLEKLSQENAELRDLCLFLNQMSGTAGSSTSTNTGTPAPKLQSTQSGPYSVHAACVTEVNATLSTDPPQYTGFTGEARLADDKQEKENNGDETERRKSDPKSYVAQLEQRLERLEQEKLELIKSLSAAHILATSTDESKDLPESPSLDENDIEQPPNIRAFIEFISDDKDTDHSANAKIAQQLSSEDILKLSTLVDVSRRLDMCNITIQDVGEMAILRALINASWEQLKNKHTKRKSPRSSKESHSTKPQTRPPQTTNVTCTSTPVPPSNSIGSPPPSHDTKNSAGAAVILRTEL